MRNNVTLIDPALSGRFYYHPIKVVDEETQREEWQDVLYIEIRAKGQKNSSQSINLSDKLKLEEYKARFPRAWAEFDRGAENVPIDGIPLAEMPQATPALIKTLNDLDIRSVEDLANAPDSAVFDIRDGYRFRQAAHAYIESMKAFSESKNIPSVGMSKTDKIDPITDSVNAQFDQMRAGNPDIEDNQENRDLTKKPKGRGRPKGSQNKKE